MKYRYYKKLVFFIFLSGMGIFMLSMFSYLTETVDADEIVSIQHPFTGEMRYIFNAGLYRQQFGKVTRYPKSFQYSFDPISVNGYDIFGSVQIELPRTANDMHELHTRYGSADAVKSELIAPVIQNIFHNISPAMNSNPIEVLIMAEDVAFNGLYKMKTYEMFIDGEIITKTAPAINENAQYIRQGQLPLASFRIIAKNFSIRKIVAVEAEHSWSEYIFIILPLVLVVAIFFSSIKNSLGKTMRDGLGFGGFK